jgi:hypothetical protein
MAGRVQPGMVLDPAMVGLEERAELIGDHDVDGHRAVAAAERIALDMPVAIAAAALAQRLDEPADRLERDDRAVIEDLVAQEVVILAGIGADIEHAIHLQAGEELAQMQGEVAFLHLAQRHDIVAQRSADLEHRVLDDLEHYVSTRADAG